MKITGIILAGGKSSRMGSDKGLLNLKGRPMIQHVIDTMNSMGLEIIIIANNSEYEQFGYPVFKDLVFEKGPIGGIYTALQSSNSEKNIIVSCDTPYVSATLLENLINASTNSNVTIAEFEGRQHPLVGVYDKNGLDVFKKHLDNDQLKLQLANEELNVHVASMTDEPKIMAMMFSNINTQEELKTLEL